MKRYLREQINRLSKIVTRTREGLGVIHSALTEWTVSFEYQWKVIFTEATCIAGKLGNTKIKRRKYDQNHKERRYIVQKTEEIKDPELKIKWKNKWFPKLTIVEVRKTDSGDNWILTHYHITCDLYLDLGRCAIIIIPYVCIEYSNSMDLTWYPSLLLKDHRRYTSLTLCKHDQILGIHKDWSIIHFIDKGTDEY